MFKYGVSLMILAAILTTSISCTCQSKTPVVDQSPPSILASSPSETMDGSLVGDGWKYGQTPQSYNTGPNQVPASEEEVQRVKDSLKELETENGTADNSF